MSNAGEQLLADESLVDPQTTRRLRLGFFSLAGLTVGLMVLGALVRAHGAGLACPDWPLCFGEFVPSMDVKVAFEWSHRLLAGSVSLLFVALGVAALQQAPIRRAIGFGLAIAALALLVQILLGAFTVWLKLAEWTVSAHLMTANFFVVVLLCIGLRIGEFTSDGIPATGTRLLKTLFAIAGLLLILQVLLGGLLAASYAGMACPAWPTCNGEQWFPSWGGGVGLHLVHRMNAYALFGVLVLLAIASLKHAGLRRVALLALLLGLIQVLVGISNVLLGLPVEITALHSALAALLVLTLTVGNWRAWRRPLSAASARAC